jgi:hypothetical protein
LSWLWALFSQLWYKLESPAYRNGPGMNRSQMQWWKHTW